MSPAVRRLILLAGLMASVAAAVAAWRDGQDEMVVDVAEPRPRTERMHPEGERRPQAGEPLLALLPRDSGSAVAPFGPEPAEALPSPAEAQPAAAVAPPAEPAMPFRYLGRMTEGGAAAVLLAYQGKDIVAQVGETLEGGYRLDEIDASEIRFTYLPLDRRQTLVIGEAK